MRYKKQIRALNRIADAEIGAQRRRVRKPSAFTAVKAYRKAHGCTISEAVKALRGGAK